MMTKKQFWQNASNWGFLGGAALFGVMLVVWGLKLEGDASLAWLVELMVFAVLCPLIVYTGRKNARLAGTQGYGYARAIGFVLAMMVFAGIVCGVGRFLLVNFIAREYYEGIGAQAFEKALAVYRNTSMYDRVSEMGESMMGWLRNPFFLIVSGIVELLFKGGFLGLVLCALVTRKPDIFAANE